jgi:outer membrane protein TolC
LSDPSGSPKQPAAAPATATSPPVVPPASSEYSIDLGTALTLAGGSNPTIALAREAVSASLAEQTLADTLALPTLNVGADFDGHTGPLQSARGQIRDVDRESAYVGAGAAAVGAGTVNVPGARAFAHVADAIFEPLVARQRVSVASFNARATNNDILLAVAVQYFTLLGAEARVGALRESDTEVEDIVRVTTNFARTGQGREADADRATSESRLLAVQTQQSEEEIAVAAAELARLLDLDPTIRLRPADPPLAPLNLVPVAEPLDRLVQVAVASRPEIIARTAGIRLAEARLREERVRPFVPLLSVGYSAGGFGGGSDQTDPRFGRFAGRSDFDVFAVWSLENMGLGNLAVQRQRRAELGQAMADRQRLIDRVRREVTDAYALVAARRVEIEAARRRLAAAQQGYRLDFARTRNLEGRPIEVLNSATTLASARQEMIASIIQFDQAQFQLFVALGQPLGTAFTSDGESTPGASAACK